MAKNIFEISEKIRKSMQDQRHRKTWQSGIGMSIFGLFVVASLVISDSVQALNRAAGNTGYYGGSYGSNATNTSSDFLPSTPASQAASAGSGQVVVSWSAVTTTTASTSLDNFSVYRVYYATTSAPVLAVSVDSSASTPSGATLISSSDDATLATQGSGTRTTTINGLTNGTTYYFAVYACDTNNNCSSAPSSAVSAAPAAVAASGGTSGGGGSGGVASGSGAAAASGAVAGPTFPAGPATTAAPAAAAPSTTAPVTSPSVVADAVSLVATLGVARNTAAEATNQTKVVQSVAELKATIDAVSTTIAVNFVTYGTSSSTIALGSGERLALVRDQLETLGRVSVAALEQLSNGQKPTDRNLGNEQKQVPLVLKVFQNLTGRSKPDFKNIKDDLAWNTLQYRIRFKRDLNKERVGITKFQGIYKRIPKSPLDWAAVRAYGYALK